jgi:hypothetical protein
MDIFFAIFPWFFIWNLQMAYREKITIAGSLSLGIVWVPLKPNIPTSSNVF